jgi:hypothetical protein
VGVIRVGSLRASEAEKVFVQVALDLKAILVLDGVDTLRDNTGFGVRCHDLDGPLPEIVIQNSRNTFVDKDAPGREACKLVVIVRLRDKLVRCLSGGELLPPTSTDDKAIVGLKVASRTWLAEGEDYMAAYRELYKQVVGRCSVSFNW